MFKPGGRGLNATFLSVAVGAVIAGWGMTGLYTVSAGQIAVVRRFGVIVGYASPGLHYHLPLPIETVEYAPTGVNRLALGDAEGDAARQMLTRDGDLINLGVTVQWRISNTDRYLAQLAAPQTTLRLAAQSAVREAVGLTSLGEILSSGRGGVSARAASLMQQALDRQGAGVTVVGLQVSDARPPEGAQAGFHDVADATADAQAGVQDAETYRNRVVADAKGEVAKTLQTSQGYRDQEISEAKGEADRFAMVDEQYRKAPDVTRERLYSETMERVLHNTRKVIVQTAPGSSSQIILPPELFRSKASDPPASSGPPPEGAAAQKQGDAQAQPPATTSSSGLTS